MRAPPPTDPAASRAVAIVTDSAASLPPEIVAEHQVRVVPMGLSLDGVAHRDGEVPMAEILSPNGPAVTTSGPSPGEYVEVMQSLLASHRAVLVLTIAETMSGTFASARLAARQLGENAARVAVVDTGTAAGAQGLAVIAAAEAAAAGHGLAEVAERAQEVCRRVRLFATLSDLDTLARSGRVPGAAAWAGRWLGLNPVFEFRDGKAHPLLPARSRDGAFDRIVSQWRSTAPPVARGEPGSGTPRRSRLHLAGLHALAAEPAHDLLARVCAEEEPASVFVAPFSAVMLAHTGPELVGLAWWWDEGG
ncbi:MAG: DegV family protein [Acidimicrobiales bacterium]